jgi:hypothetical protein
MAGFFVIREYRRCRIGTETAHEVLRRFPGLWKVHVIRSNHPARLEPEAAQRGNTAKDTLGRPAWWAAGNPLRSAGRNCEPANAPHDVAVYRLVSRRASSNSACRFATDNANRSFPASGGGNGPVAPVSKTVTVRSHGDRGVGSQMIVTALSL